MEYICKTETFQTIWDENASLKQLVYGHAIIEPRIDCTYYSIDDNPIRWRFEALEGDGFCYLPEDISDDRRASIRSNEKLPPSFSGTRLKIFSSGNEAVLALNPAEKPLFEPSTRMTLCLTVPDNAVIHLAEYLHTGHLLESDMAYEHWYECNLCYNMIAIEFDGIVIRLRTQDENLFSASARVWRHKETFTICFSWKWQSQGYISIFSSLEQAVTDHVNWAQKYKGLRRLRDRSDIPDWIHNIRLVITLDLLNSRWDICHSFSDIAKLAEEMAQFIQPHKVLFYLVGWNGAFDSNYPNYKPAQECGGEAAFESMLQTLRKAGFRVMLHTCVFGIDPYLQNIDELEGIARRTEDEKLYGWQINDQWMPSAKTFPFQSKRIHIDKFRNKEYFSINIGYVPGDCSAYVTVGDVRGRGRIRIRHNKCSVVSPCDWFSVHDSYDYIYPLQLSCGETELIVELIDDDGLDIDNAWIQVRKALAPETPYSTWTHPILIGNGDCDEFLLMITDNISSMVKRYSVDAVHLDAASFYRPFNNKSIYHSVKNCLPHGVILACEWFWTWEELDFHTICQISVKNLVTVKLPQVCVKEANNPPVLEGLESYYSWMNKTSPICNFSSEYIYCYSHLCAADAFVPTRKVCHIYPPRKLPLSSAELLESINESQRLKYIPAIRVNYREYGLDIETVQALQMINSWQD